MLSTAAVGMLTLELSRLVPVGVTFGKHSGKRRVRNEGRGEKCRLEGARGRESKRPPCSYRKAGRAGIAEGGRFRFLEEAPRRLETG